MLNGSKTVSKRQFPSCIVAQLLRDFFPATLFTNQNICGQHGPKVDLLIQDTIGATLAGLMHAVSQIGLRQSLSHAPSHYLERSLSLAIT